MSEPCGHVRTLLGPEVLGLLDDREHAEVQAHLARCADCAGEHARLEVVPELIDLAAPDGTDPVAAPPGLEQAVLDRYAHDLGATRRRRLSRRRLVPAIVGTVAGLAVVVGFILGTGILGGQEGWAYPMKGLGPAAGATAQARISVDPGGTEVRLQATGLPDSGSGHYEMWFRDGSRVVSAGGFRVGRDGSADVQLTTSADPRHFRTMGVTLEPDQRDPARNGVQVLVGRIDEGHSSRA
jgi:hypothetical protein